MGESRLEDALLDRLQNFFWSWDTVSVLKRDEKRIMLDDEHAFVDIVFITVCSSATS